MPLLTRRESDSKALRFVLAFETVIEVVRARSTLECTMNACQ